MKKLRTYQLAVYTNCAKIHKKVINRLIAGLPDPAVLVMIQFYANEVT